jgi:ribonuclease D
MNYELITETDALADLCKTLAKEPFVTVDTEFLREKTYHAQLCLVQIGGEELFAAIDPLADGIDLTPLFTLLANPKVLKVFHAARQDLEIFYRLMGSVPTPLFDTQIAAQVLGMGENLGYEALIRKRLNTQIDKGQQFTDWSQRPLTESQLNYAMGDVIHLRGAYLSMVTELEERGRSSWLEGEMAALTEESAYFIEPDEAWKRVRHRLKKPPQIGRLRQFAAWREDKAQSLDLPRNRIIRDDALVELATNLPKSIEAMKKTRAFPQHLKGELREELWRLCEALPELPESEWVEYEARPRSNAKTEGRLEMLRLLMKQNTRAHDVAASFIANRETLENFASGHYDTTHPLLQGWRYEVFGKDAEELLQGKRAAILDPETGDIRFQEI